MAEETKAKHDAPEKVFRSGLVQLAVWKNKQTIKTGEKKGETFDSYSFTLKRSYPVDGPKKFDDTTSMRPVDLARVNVLFAEAQRWWFLEKGHEKEQE